MLQFAVEKALTHGNFTILSYNDINSILFRVTALVSYCPAMPDNFFRRTNFYWTLRQGRHYFLKQLVDRVFTRLNTVPLFPD